MLIKFSLVDKVCVHIHIVQPNHTVNLHSLFYFVNILNLLFSKDKLVKVGPQVLDSTSAELIALLNEEQGIKILIIHI